MKISTEYYDPRFFTEGPSERSRTMFGDADIQGNLTSGFSYQDLLKFLDANPKTLAETNAKGVGGGVYEKVRLGAKQEQDAATRQQELDQIASNAEAEQQRQQLNKKDVYKNWKLLVGLRNKTNLLVAEQLNYNCKVFLDYLVHREVQVHSNVDLYKSNHKFQQDYHLLLLLLFFQVLMYNDCSITL